MPAGRISIACVVRRQPNQAALEGVACGNGLTVEIDELAQRQSIGDSFARLATLPALHANKNQRVPWRITKT
jgi:hypothetical protein